VSRTRVDWNGASAVVSVEHQGRRILFCGDANEATWQEILRRIASDEAVKSDVVVAWHHGAKLGKVKGSDYDKLVWSRVLRRVKRNDRTVVVISHGCNNRYGHPHEETIWSAVDAGGEILCTKLKFRSDSENVDHDEACAGLGYAVDYDEPSDVEIYKAGDGACSGDTTIEVGNRGAVRVWTSGPRDLGGAPSAGCCLIVSDS